MNVEIIKTCYLKSTEIFKFNWHANNELYTEFPLHFEEVKSKNSELAEYKNFYEKRIIVRDLNSKLLTEQNLL